MTSVLFLLFSCSITTIVDSSAQIVEENVEVIVSKPPNKVKIEVDGAESSNLIVNYRESRNKKVEKQTEIKFQAYLVYIGFVPNVQ